MQLVLKLNKCVGETPLECINRFRRDNPVYEKTNMTYVGRLDPMAEGLLLVLAGDTRDKDQYLGFDKTYEFEVLWGFETDTYDILGLVTGTSTPVISPEGLEKVVSKIKNKKTQEYPPYSSRTVAGKALFAWAREGRIDEVDIPTRHIKIFDIVHVHTRLLRQSEILEEIARKVSMVIGDFRQTQIIDRWRETIDPKETALVSLFRADVSSGTYVRSLAHEMGEMLDTSACAYSIKRTRVGEYRL